MWIGAPIIAAWSIADRSSPAGAVADYQPLLLTLLALTTATITGTFMFMTFRIDRDTRQTAERVAKDEVDKVLKKKKEEADKALAEIVKKSEQSLSSLDVVKNNATKVVNNKLTEIINKAKQDVDGAVSNRLDARVTPDEIRKGVTDRLTAEALREHIGALLMLDANGLVVAEYAKERAGDLDRKSIARLIQLMENVIQSIPNDAPKKRNEEDTGWLERIRAPFARRR